MSEFGVRCQMADGDDAIITVDAPNGAEAWHRVMRHKQLFYGPGDGAGEYLARGNSSKTIVRVFEAKPLSEWESRGS